MTVAGARRILDANRLVLGIGHERRFEPALEEACRLIASGEVGTLIALDANVSHDLFQNVPANNWRRQKADAPAGLYTGVGVHLTDLFVALAGPVSWVQAWAASRIFEPPAEDVLMAKIGFASGVHASLTCLSATPYYGRFTAQGSRGWLEVLEGGNVDQGLPAELISSNAAGQQTRRSYAPSNTVLANFEAWADAVEGRAPYRITADEILENTKIFEGIVCSAAAKGALVLFTPR
jgi:predicted dehydrogenase